MLFSTLYAVLVLSMILVLGNLFRQIRPLLVEQVDQAEQLGLVFKFVLSVLPASLMFTIPWGFLTAVLLVFGRLSSDQEITGFRVAGVSLARLSVPVFAIGALLSAFSLYLNVNIVPQAKSWMTELLYEQGRKNPASLLDPGIAQSQLKGDKKLFVESRDGDKTLVGFHMYFLNDDKEPAKDGKEMQKAYLHAGRGTFIVDEEKRQFRFRLKDAFIETRNVDGSVVPVFAGEVEPVIWDYKFRSRKDNSNAMNNEEIRRYLVDHPEMKESRQVEFRAEITKRYSFSMACLAFAFVGIPLSLKSRRKDTSTGLVLSLLLGAAYFMFTVLSSEFKSDAGATVMLWLPNLLCVLVGLFLFRRARFK